MLPDPAPARTSAELTEMDPAPIVSNGYETLASHSNAPDTRNSTSLGDHNGATPDTSISDVILNCTISSEATSYAAPTKGPITTICLSTASTFTSAVDGMSAARKASNPPAVPCIESMIACLFASVSTQPSVSPTSVNVMYIPPDRSWSCATPCKTVPDRVT